MKKTIAKLVISVAIGLIVGEYFGNKNEIVKYFETDSKKTEISKQQFYEIDDASYTMKETHFNYRSFLTYSITTSSILLVILFIGDLRKKDE